MIRAHLSLQLLVPLCWVFLSAFGAVAAASGTAAQLCARLGTDDTLRPIPASLVPQVNAVFHSSMPARIAQDSSVFRCDQGQVLVCTTGANLPCGKANTDRTNAGAQAWCQAHPDAAVVPAFARGHATIFAWGCHGTSAAIVRQVNTVDRRGFVADYWRPLP